jgi:hypothetical protein
MAEEPAPALVATPDEAQKTVLDQMLRSKRQRVNIARDFAVLEHGRLRYATEGPLRAESSRPCPQTSICTMCWMNGSSRTCDPASRVTAPSCGMPMTVFWPSRQSRRPSGSRRAGPAARPVRAHAPPDQDAARRLSLSSAGWPMPLGCGRHHVRLPRLYPREVVAR